MRRSVPRLPASRTDGEAADRLEAARLLRAARTAAGTGRHTAAEQALALHPDGRHARRLLIDALLDTGDTAAADHLIAEGLLQRPTDAALSRLRARSLLAQGDHRGAEREIRLALHGRPRHAGTLLLAAQIASARGEIHTAVRRLEEASAVRPACDEPRARLAGALLDGGAIERAIEVIGTLGAPPALLRARLAAARGRREDAVQVLLEAHADPGPSDETDLIQCALIDQLEEMEDETRLRSALAGARPDRPRELARAARGWLSIGEFRTAVIHAAALRHERRLAGEALAVLAIAAAMAGRARLAERALARGRRAPGALAPPAVADLWRRAFTARAFRSARPQPAAAHTEPADGVLTPLLSVAVETFTREAERCRRRRRSAAAAAAERHRAVCLAALGRRSDARAALGCALAGR